MQWFQRPVTFPRSNSMFHRYLKSHRHNRICTRSEWWCWGPESDEFRVSHSMRHPHILRSFVIRPTRCGWWSQNVNHSTRLVKSKLKAFTFISLEQKDSTRTYKLEDFHEDCCDCLDWRHVELVCWKSFTLLYSQAALKADWKRLVMTAGVKVCLRYPSRQWIQINVCTKAISCYSTSTYEWEMNCARYNARYQTSRCWCESRFTEDKGEIR